MKISKSNILLATAMIAIIGFYVCKATSNVVLADDYQMKMQAVAQTKKAFAAIKQEKIARGIPIDTTLDPLQTGMIGEMHNEITTTLGHLNAKQMSANPDFAAVFIHMFNQLSLQPGDYVAVNASSSFPSLQVAFICAAEVFGLHLVPITSLGASTYGANNLELTYYEMETLLRQQNIIQTQSMYFSMGGENDVGKNTNPITLETLQKRLAIPTEKWINEPQLEKNIAFRIGVYEQFHVACFVNIGGNSAAFGNVEIDLSQLHGIVGISCATPKLPSFQTKDGLIAYFLHKQVPVIHMLNINKIANEYGLVFLDTKPSGTSPIYFQTVYHAWLGVIFFFLVCLGVIFYGKKNKEAFV